MKHTLRSSLFLAALTVGAPAWAQRRRPHPAAQPAAQPAPAQPAPAQPATPPPAPVEQAAPAVAAPPPPPAQTAECAAAGVPAVQNPTNSQLDEARQHLRQGIELLQSNRYGDAVLELRAARDVRASPNIMFNLALSLRGAGRNRDAAHTFRCYLDIAGATAPADVRTQVQQAITELQRAIGRVEVQVEPANATVTIGGEAVDVSHGPLEVDPGRLVIAASAEGYSTETQRVLVGPGATAQVVLRLPQANSVQRVSVRVSNVPAARIYIDDNLVGTQAVDENVRPGRHRIRVTATDYTTFERFLDTTAGGAPSTVNVRLEGGVPLARNPVFWGILVPSVLAVAGGVTAGLIVGLSSPDPPIQGTWNITVMALRRH